jgi:hypothetical protein
MNLVVRSINPVAAWLTADRSVAHSGGNETSILQPELEYVVLDPAKVVMVSHKLK